MSSFLDIKKPDNKTKTHIEKWKKHLIDFSRRNQLLYFKLKSTMTIEIEDSPLDIFDSLVFKNNSLKFKESIDLSMQGDDFAFEEEGFDLPPAPMLEEGIASSTSSSLQTTKEAKALEQSLSKLRTRSKASLQEQGVNILYLAMYFLEWHDGKDEAVSPLLLIPVSLDRKGLSGDFRLSHLDDELRINPTLAYKLERDFGIDLSSFEEALVEIENVEELEALIEKITETIQEAKTDWLIKDSSYLSLFSFVKLSLYKDIENHSEKISVHPVIQAMTGTGSLEENSFEPASTKISEILDADSSQQEAIKAAREGKSFVIQGPPGTGKSQTIANIIADSLAQNKKILFVSEKKSALEVVARRLGQSSLDKFCLELHNSGQKKSEIIEKIRSSLEEIKNLALENQRDEYLEDIEALEEEIQTGIDQLHKVRKPINRSLYEIYGELSKLNLELEDTDLDFTLKNIEKINLERLNDFENFFNKLGTQSKILCNYHDFIWRGANVANLSFELENEIKSNLLEFKHLLSKLGEHAGPIAREYFNRDVENIKEFKWLAEASSLAINSPFPNKDWFSQDKLSEVQTLTIEAKIEYEEYQTSKSNILERYSDGFLELDHQELLTKFTQKFTGIFRFLSFDYWKTMGQIKRLSLYNEARDLNVLVNDIQAAILLEQQEGEIVKEGTELSLKLGEFYREFDTDWNETLVAINWVKKVLGKFEAQQLPSALLDTISDSKDEVGYDDFRSKAESLIQSYELLKYHLKFYKSIFPNPIHDIENMSFNELSEHIEELVKNIVEIEDWIEFKELYDLAKRNNLNQFLDAIIDHGFDSVDGNLIKSLFLRKLYQLWIDKIEIENPVMRKFSGEKQELLITRFNNLDERIIEKNQSYIAKTLALNWIEFASNLINKTDLQILNHELNKKRKHKPMRLLIKEIPALLQTLKPCWMMSPLSVSQLIETDKLGEFDLVIFDEASQIRTEDAICSIYRGKQLILAGDSNQLPPTNFFSYVSEDDDFEENNFESVLDECSVFLESKTLNWHYRSRHEDLIKFSNQHIYDDKLITFPSPAAKSELYGVDFELIENGYYEKGSRFNRREAVRVAEAIVQHYTNHQELSLGVIAFSEAQQMAIERELAKLLRKEENKDLDQSFMDEEAAQSLFIKNLENVQGDERDFIFFSIGYARDKEANLSHNFGPLNREGGHRRLNVAVTRARNKLKVFSSITGADIDLSRTSAQGALLLKKYLSYAEEAQTLSQLTCDSNDAILESIARTIEDKGYQVERLWGSSEYRIDIAVRDQEDPAKFILAIETDGQIYQSAKTTRDRERLRKQVLESLGWNAKRIYARDWIKNPNKELERVFLSR